MKLKSIITAVLLVAIVSTFIGCFDIAKTDVDTEQELLKILGESEDSSNGESSNDVVVYFDNDPDKFLEVVKNDTSGEKDSVENDTVNEETNNTDNSYISEESVSDYKADNTEAKDDYSFVSDNHNPETSDTVVDNSSSFSSQIENESADTTVIDNSGGNTNSETNSSGNSSSSGNTNFSSTEVSSDSDNSNQITYVLNTNTKKFHYKSCGSASQIKPKNYAEATGRDSIIAKGYQPCKRCNP